MKDTAILFLTQKLCFSVSFSIASDKQGIHKLQENANQRKKVQETKTLILCVPVVHLIFRARATFPVPVCTVSPDIRPTLGK